VFIITGSTSGVGYSLSKILYEKNATVYLAARNAEKAAQRIAEAKNLSPNSSGKLEFLELDLSDLASIKPSVEYFLAKEKRLDVLWLNAGVMFPPTGSKTAQVQSCILL
jgi:retinol dehydrogenase-12